MSHDTVRHTEGLLEEELLPTHADRSRLRLVWEGGEATVHARHVLGAANEVDVPLPHATVSALHAEVEGRTDGLWIRDLGSKNGVWVDGVRVIQARLAAGQALRIGGLAVEVAAADQASVELWPASTFGPLIGRSEPMRALFRVLARYAPTDETVLIGGETGTGKELVARALHDASPRSEGPFGVIDCAALPATLLESELFGHAAGAYTGADQARTGLFEACEGGTVFIDEIGELPLAMQPTLLRVLEQRTVRRLGELDTRPIDVRVVCASHRDLRRMVNEGGFREDLYFRIAVLPLHVPALRERPGDARLLARHFADEMEGDLDAAALSDIERRPWHGNVRELRSHVARWLALGAETAAALDPAPAGIALPMPRTDLRYAEVRDRWIAHLERSYLARLLETHDGNVSAVARASGLDRSYVHRMIKRHQLD